LPAGLGRAGVVALDGHYLMLDGILNPWQIFTKALGQETGVGQQPLPVMAGLGPAIHVLFSPQGRGMPSPLPTIEDSRGCPAQGSTRPGMTKVGVASPLA
jgi:hypothetical protein